MLKEAETPHRLRTSVNFSRRVLSCWIVSQQKSSYIKANLPHPVKHQRLLTTRATFVISCFHSFSQSTTAGSVVLLFAAESRAASLNPQHCPQILDMEISLSAFARYVAQC